MSEKSQRSYKSIWSIFLIPTVIFCLGLAGLILALVKEQGFDVFATVLLAVGPMVILWASFRKRK